MRITNGSNSNYIMNRTIRGGGNKSNKVCSEPRVIRRVLNYSNVGNLASKIEIRLHNREGKLLEAISIP